MGARSAHRFNTILDGTVVHMVAASCGARVMHVGFCTGGWASVPAACSQFECLGRHAGPWTDEHQEAGHHCCRRHPGGTTVVTVMKWPTHVLAEC